MNNFQVKQNQFNEISDNKMYPKTFHNSMYKNVVALCDRSFTAGRTKVLGTTCRQMLA